MAALATVMVAAALAPAASASQQCLGLDCPGVTPATSTAHGLVQIASSPRALETTRISGFYDFGTNGPSKTRAVAYVAAAGEWNAAPTEIKNLMIKNALSAEERAHNTIVVYSATTVISVAPASSSTSTAPAGGVAPAAFSDCTSGAFCLFDNSNGTGAKGTWADTGYWQNLSDWGWQGRGSSMNNRRNGWTLLERSDNAHYCAQPNSQDGDLGNNGYNNNTSRVYLSTSTTKQSGWACTN